MHTYHFYSLILLRFQKYYLLFLSYVQGNWDAEKATCHCYFPKPEAQPKAEPSLSSSSPEASLAASRTTRVLILSLKYNEHDE